MLTPYAVDNSAEFYDKYYSAQAGYGLSFFEGKKVMEGNGIFSGLMKSALPMLKNIGKKALTRVVNGGVEVARDVLSGKDLGRSAVRGLKRVGTGALADVEEALNSRPRKKKRKRTAQRGRGATVFDL